MKTIKKLEAEKGFIGVYSYHNGYLEALKDMVKLIDEMHQRSLISYTTYLEFKKRIEG